MRSLLALAILVTIAGCAKEEAAPAESGAPSASTAPASAPGGGGGMGGVGSAALDQARGAAGKASAGSSMAAESGE